MRSHGVYDSIKDKLVFGENVAQTFQFVQSGAADIGIVALSLALAPEARSQGRYWEVPLDAHPLIEQGGIILKWTKQPEAAQAFRSFVLGAKGQASSEEVWVFSTGGLNIGLGRHRFKCSSFALDYRHPFPGRTAYRLLVDLLQMTVEVPGRNRRCFASGPSAHGARLLHPVVNRAEESDWRNLFGAHRTSPAIFLPWASDCLRSLQSSFHCPALCVSVQGCR